MKSDKRVRALQIIYDYIVKQHFDRVVVTAKDIVRFYKLPPGCSHSFAATMRYVHASKKAIYGFRVTKIRDFNKERYPTKYTIELVKETVE